MGKSIWMKDENVKGNFSNNQTATFDHEKGYTGVRLQQGVPLMDRDWNEFDDMRRYSEHSLKKHYFGNGVPDTLSYRIRALSTPGNDFTIYKGRCLVEGFEIMNITTGEDDFISYSSQASRHGYVPLTENNTENTRVDMVYLDVWVSEITGDEDESLKNLQDISIESSTLHKIEWVVWVSEGSETYATEENHYYYNIAKINRPGNSENITAPMITDLRVTELTLKNILEKNMEELNALINAPETAFNKIYDSQERFISRTYKPNTILLLKPTMVF